MTFSPELLQVVGSVAGIGGVALISCVYLFKDIIRRKIFPTLSKEHAFRIIRYIIFAFTFITIFGISTYAYSIYIGGDNIDQREEMLWESIKDSKSIKNIRLYVNKYPNGFFSVAAQVKINDLEEKERIRESSRDQQFWSTIKATKDYRQFKAYIETFPKGKYLKLAEIQMEDIINVEEEKKAFELKLIREKEKEKEDRLLKKKKEKEDRLLKKKKEKEDRLLKKKKEKENLIIENKKEDRRLKKKKEKESLLIKLNNKMNTSISLNKLLKEKNWTNVAILLQKYNKLKTNYDSSKRRYDIELDDYRLDKLNKEKESLTKRFIASMKERDSNILRIDELAGSGKPKSQIKTSYIYLRTKHNSIVDQLNKIGVKVSKIDDKINKINQEFLQNQKELEPSLNKATTDFKNISNKLLNSINIASKLDSDGAIEYTTPSIQSIIGEILFGTDLKQPLVSFDKTLNRLTIWFNKVKIKERFEYSNYEYLKVVVFTGKTSFGDIVYAKKAFGFKVDNNDISFKELYSF